MHPASSKLKRVSICILFFLTFIPALFSFKVPDDMAPFEDLVFADPSMWVTAQHQDVSEIEALLNMELQSDWRRFLADHEGKWVMVVDRVTGRPAHMEGKGIPWIPGTANDLTGYDLGFSGDMEGKDVPLEFLITRVKSFLSEYPGLLRVNMDNLEVIPAASGPMLDYLYFVDFQWTYGGVPVDQAHVVFRLNHGNLVQIGQEYISDSIYSLNPVPKLSQQDAWETLWNYVGGRYEEDTIINEGSLRILPVSRPEVVARTVVQPGEGLDYRLAYILSFRRNGYHGTWEAKIDAHTGEILWFADANRYGDAHGSVYPTDQHPWTTPNPDPEVDRPFPYVDCGGGVYANAGGIFTGDSCTSALSGKYTRISDACGSISLSTSTGDLNFGYSPATDCSNPGFGGSGNTRATRTQYYHITNIKMKALTYLPSNSWLNGQITDNVNINSTCNAYWSPTLGTINFYRSGNGCWNTGELPGVSLHEWAHGLDSNDGSPSGDMGTGETYGDFSGSLQTHESCAGNGFLGTSNCSGYGDSCLSCSGVRDMDYNKHNSHSPHFAEDMTSNTCTGCTTYTCSSSATYAGPCGREGHCESIVSSEPMWDLPTRDLITWGLDATTAWQLMDRYWYASRTTSGSVYACPSVTTTNGCGTSNYFTTFRVVDDCDGDLNNGTPHASAIFAAFNRHKIACTTVNNNDQTNCCPTIVTPTINGAAGNTQATITWGSVTNAAKYYVFRNELGCDAGFTKVGTVTAPGTQYVDNTVANGVSYYYRVQAIGSSESCFSSMSNCVTVVPQPCTTPGAPASVTSSVPGDNQIRISWSTGSPAGSSYKIYRSLGSCPGSAFSFYATDSASPYTDTLVNGGQTYSYYVTAVDSTGGCESLPSTCVDETATGICNTPPTFAGLQTVTNSATSTCTLNLSWSAATSNCSGTITYSVYRSTTSGFTPGSTNRIAQNLSGSSYSDTGSLISGTTYYYVVRATDSANGLEETNTVEKSGVPTGPSSVIFSDNFEGGNLGWTFAKGSPAATLGDFIIGDPVGTTGNYGDNSQPEDDHTPSPGVNCMYTAANPTAGAGTDDVDNGEVVTTSPAFSGSGYDSVSLSLWRWFFNEDTDDAGDYYILEVSNNNGTSWTELESIPDTVLGTNSWNQVSFNLEDFVTLTSTMRIRMRVADGTAVGDLIEAAFDDIVITGFSTCTTSGACASVSATISSATPNPACTGQNISFSGTGTGEGTLTYSWDFEDDGTYDANGQNVTHAYGTANTYTVRLRVTDSCGTPQTATTTTTVTVNTTPAIPATPTVSDLDACATSGVQITWTSVSGATGYDLSVDGAITSDVTSPYPYNPGDNASHAYRIRSKNDCGTSSWSSARNFSDANGTPATPSAPSVSDLDSCDLTGVQITWGSVSGATGYDLLVDGTTTVTNVTSPHNYSPGNSSSHTYAIRAKNSCTGSWSGATSATDVNNAPGTPAQPAVSDLDACTLTGVRITWGSVSGATGYDLLVDGTTTISNVTSPYDYSPGNNANHTYAVLAKTASCTGSWSTATIAADGDDNLGTPGAPLVSDPDACDQTGVSISWSPVAGADGYDLQVDGGTIVTNVTSPYTYNPGNLNSHTYAIRATNTCGDGSFSGATSFADGDDTPGTPGSPTVSDVDGCALSGVSITWGGVSGATGYDLLVDGTTTVTNVTSPYTYSPGNSASHTYAIRAKTTCLGAWSTATAGVDENNAPAPTISGAAGNVCPSMSVDLSTQGFDSYQWKLDGSDIPGANSQAYSATASGTYTVAVTLSGCSATSPGHAVTITPCAPNLEYSQHQWIEDTVNGGGDNDGIIEPGERWTLRVGMVNTGNAVAVNPYADITLANGAADGTVCITPLTYSPDIPADGTTEGFADYIVVVDASFTCGGTLYANLVNKGASGFAAPSAGPDEADVISIQIGSVGGGNDYYAEDDFESGDLLGGTGDWVEAQWTLAFNGGIATAPLCPTTSNTYEAYLGARTNNPRNHTLTRSITADGATSGTLHFVYQLNNTLDSGEYFQVSIDSGSGYQAILGPITQGAGSGICVTEDLDLTPYLPATALSIQFHLYQGNSSSEWVTFDEVQVTLTGGGTPNCDIGTGSCPVLTAPEVSDPHGAGWPGDALLVTKGSSSNLVNLDFEDVSMSSYNVYVSKYPTTTETEPFRVLSADDGTHYCDASPSCDGTTCTLSDVDLCGSGTINNCLVDQPTLFILVTADVGIVEGALGEDSSTNLRTADDWCVGP
ncbi:MAG TPA: PKD domain-containing protein [Thermoanaerobaculia bacterium]|nr:PKD domain-containing protein [Thermoanaerobaculia bacterium]HUM30279.1 PKD domain-containing protein [Thermoanaerobaculia bacterium]HXK68425.1 PKD domain-containing protein [Thermoanaerobaculia bacterium]